MSHSSRGVLDKLVVTAFMRSGIIRSGTFQSTLVQPTDPTSRVTTNRFQTRSQGRARRQMKGGLSGRVRLLLVLAIAAGLSCRRVEESKPVLRPPEIIATKTGLEMVLIPSGRFTMGSDASEPDEAPAHELSVDAFLIDRYEVTQETFAKLAGRNPYLARDPSHFKGPRRPVEMVSWPDAVLWCNERSRAEGLKPCYDDQTGECDFEADGYRLPTEAEWEYACRAGGRPDDGHGSDPRDLGRYAWYKPNASKTTRPVGQKEPNAWGLFDMLGNVAEWCNDVYDQDYYQRSPRENPRGPAEGDRRVLRGGAWSSGAEACRGSFRAGEDPGFQDACFARDAIGFRCVRRAP